MRVQKGSAIHHVRMSCWSFLSPISNANASFQSLIDQGRDVRSGELGTSSSICIQGCNDVHNTVPMRYVVSDLSLKTS